MGKVTSKHPGRSNPNKPSKPYLPPTKAVNIGAPSTAGQSSRKGKKAWRKNIDIGDEEAALEITREEERITGGRLGDKGNNDLFMVDTVGDADVAKSLPKRTSKPLRSLAILSERSAVPSLFSRSTTAPSNPKKTSIREKHRLRRTALKDLAEADGRGLASGSTSKISSDSLIDVWSQPTLPGIPVSTKVKEIKLPPGGFGQEGMIKPFVKTPLTIQRQREIHALQASYRKDMGIPTGGVSYNPAVEAHNTLMKAALDEELERLKEEQEEAERVKVLGGVIEGRKRPDIGEYAEGMVIGPGEVDDDDEDNDEVADSGEQKKKKPTIRKTQAQRNKTLRLKEEAQAEKARKQLEKLHKSIGTAPTVKKAHERRLKEMKEKQLQKMLMRREKERLGFEGGEKIGKYKIKKGVVDVQLGEDLAESLRLIKPEGNRFGDHFLNLQRKALIEPRMPQQPKRRVRKIKEYEKHPWKRFE